jgi:hypothetical protein
MDLWQSPKSKPHSLIVLSAEALTSVVLSSEMSMESTGSLWPYRDRNSFSVSRWKTLMWLSTVARR